MRAEQWVQDLTRWWGALTNDEDLKNGYQKICEPKIGDIVFYKNKEGAFQTVKILGGQYLDSEYGRLSNFWYWVDVGGDGTESKEERKGYGSFFIKTNQPSAE